MKLGDYDRMPPVAVAMTPFPYYVREDASLDEVERLIADHGVRRIPVVSDGRVVGMISQNDLKRLDIPALPSVDRDQLLVRDVHHREPYIVEMQTPLDEVVATMAERRIASAIVVRGGKLAGIFTVSDACRLLADFLDDRFGPDPSGDAA